MLCSRLKMQSHAWVATALCTCAEKNYYWYLRIFLYVLLDVLCFYSKGIEEYLKCIYLIIFFGSGKKPLIRFWDGLNLFLVCVWFCTDSKRMLWIPLPFPLASPVVLRMANKKKYLIRKLIASVIIIIAKIIIKEMKRRQKMREKTGEKTSKWGCGWLPLPFLF